MFVVPDKDGEVYDKVYDFSDESEKDFLALAQAVYKATSTLEFMDDPEVFIAADNKRGLKEIKEFVALLLAKNDKEG